MQLHEKMWLIIKALPVIYFTAVCSAQEDSRKPSLKLLTKWLDVFEDEVLAFQCDINDTSDWTFSWYKDGVKVVEDPDQDLTIDEEGGAVLNITSASKSKEGSYTCQAHLESSSITTQKSDPAKVTVYDNIPTPTLHKDPGFNPMYAGEKVNFICNVDVSTDWEYQWMKNGIDDESAARKSYSFLVGHNDQGKYSCKATRGERVATDSSEEKQLDVLENPVPTLTKKTPWLDVFPEESVQLQCEMAGSSDWTFTWGKDGGDIQADDVVSFDSSGAVLTIKSASVAHAGQYTCRGHLKGRSVSSNSSTAITLTVYNKKPSVMLTQDPDFRVMFSGETVSYSCHLNVSSGWEYLWYRDEKPLLFTGKRQRFTPSPRHTGKYTCRAKRTGSQEFLTDLSPAVDLEVIGSKPKPVLTQQPDANKLYVGELVNLECRVEIGSDWEYMWYKDGALQPVKNSRLTIKASSSDSGIYTCIAMREKTQFKTDFSKERTFIVSDIPIPSTKLKAPWLDVFPSESTELSCQMDGSSDWIHTWYKDNQKVQVDQSISFKDDAATLTIKSASSSHRGRYSCSAKLKSRSVYSNMSAELTLSVHDKKPSVMLTQDPDFRVMFSGETVSYSCHLNVSSGWEYLWYRDEKPLLFTGNRQQFNPNPGDTGKYKCRAKRTGSQEFLTDLSSAVDLEVIGSKPKPVLTQQPDANKLYVGELVHLECRVEIGSDWEYMWYKDEAPQTVNNSRLTIKASSSDSGTYKCMAIRAKTMYSTGFSKERTFIVSDIPIPSTKLNRPWPDVFPSESTELSCQMDGSSDWIHTWYKDNQKVQDDQSISFKDDAATLTIKSASSSHHGRYSCSAKLKSRSVYSNMSAELTLSVYDKKPRVTLTQRPVYEVMHSGDLVSFSCHVNVSSGWQYEWLKGGKNTGRSGDNYTITSVETTHTGSYKCQVKRGQNTVFLSPQSQTVNLTVLERPQATITLLTGWSEVFSTDSLVLKCGVPDSLDTDWNYTWFRESKAINTSHSQKYAVTPQNDPEQSVYTCKGISTGRPSYSKYSEPLKTKNLLLKRRVLLSISGIIFFGIIAVFLGCIVLRFTRKPDDVDKPEEEDLFLKMVQSTGTDVPCPLVEFITDESLKASSKEADENGTISSETTPLPITTQEDQAVSSDSPDTTENNGGLVSFKQ